MLNTFPNLLVLGFFAPTIIRVAAALAFGYMAYVQYKRRSQIAELRLPFGAGGGWVAWLMVTFNLAVATMLLFGYYTQIAAILAVAALVKSLVFKRWYPSAVPLSRVSILLLAVMCLSLLISGAGAIAYDLPL